jgi:leucyl-tRNA synthetase
MNFNTGVAALMELTNEIYDFDKKADESNPGDLFALKEALEALVKMLAPYTPHIAEELWAALGHSDFVVVSPWPAFDAELAQADELEIPVQINGKMSGRVIVAAEIDDEALKQTVFNDEKIKAKIGERQIVKTIVVPKRLVNVVVK